MEISTKMAQEIVTQMNTIIDQDINFMNNEAQIIASTNYQRVGQFHEGAKKVLSTEEALVIEDDSLYYGSKNGINIPIKFEEQIIGVIGITGNKDIVSKCGEIIRKMSEILIKEDYLKNINFKKRLRNRYLIEDIIYSNEPQLLETFDDECIAIVGKPYGDLVLDYDYIYTILEEDDEIVNDSVYAIINDAIYLLFKNDNECIDNKLNSLNKLFKSRLNEVFFYGVGEPIDSIKFAKSSFEKAMDALKWNISYLKKDIVYYRDMDLGLLLTSLDANKVNEFTSNVLHKIPSEEMKQLKIVFFTYGKMNKSISKSSEKLFMHKNSFQYKLNKIKKYTGYDPKKLNDYVVIYLAFVLSEE